MRFRWKWLWGSVGAVGAMVTFAANVSTSTAVSNISGWLHWAHLDRLATGLANPQVNQFAREGGIAAVVGCILYFVIKLAVDRFDPPRDPGRKCVSISEAGEWLYAHGSENIRAAMRAFVPGLVPHVRSYGGLLVMDAAMKGVCPLYGRWSEGLPLERIDPMEFSRSAYEATFGPTKLKPIDPSIRKYDLKSVLAHYERSALSAPSPQVTG